VATRPETKRRPKSRDGSNGNIDPADLEALLHALESASAGDLSVRLSARRSGVVGDLNAAFNRLAAQQTDLAKELGRVCRTIGREGRMTERAALAESGGTWGVSVDAVNSMIDDLVRPTTEVARVLGAVAEGDLSQKMALTIEGRPLRGEFLRIGTTVNSMVDQLS
jgi:methyl-accepting chemotaxis protein